MNEGNLIEKNSSFEVFEVEEAKGRNREMKSDTTFFSYKDNLLKESNYIKGFKVIDAVFFFFSFISACPLFSFVDSSPVIVSLILLFLMTSGVKINREIFQGLLFIYTLGVAIFKIVWSSHQEKGTTITNLGLLYIDAKFSILSLLPQVTLAVASFTFLVLKIFCCRFRGRFPILYKGKKKNLVITILTLLIYIVTTIIVGINYSKFSFFLLIISHFQLYSSTLINSPSFKPVSLTALIFNQLLYVFYISFVNIINIKFFRELKNKELLIRFVNLNIISDVIKGDNKNLIIKEIIVYLLSALNVVLIFVQIKLIYSSKDLIDDHMPEKDNKKQNFFRNLKNYFCSYLKSSFFYFNLSRMGLFFWIIINEEFFSLFYLFWIVLSFYIQKKRIILVSLKLLIIPLFAQLYLMYFYFVSQKEDDKTKDILKIFQFNCILFSIWLSLLFYQENEETTDSLIDVGEMKQKYPLLKGEKDSQINLIEEEKESFSKLDEINSVSLKEEEEEYEEHQKTLSLFEIFLKFFFQLYDILYISFGFFVFFRFYRIDYTLLIVVFLMQSISPRDLKINYVLQALCLISFSISYFIRLRQKSLVQLDPFIPVFIYLLFFAQIIFSSSTYLALKDKKNILHNYFLTKYKDAKKAKCFYNLTIRYFSYSKLILLLIVLIILPCYKNSPNIFLFIQLIFIFIFMSSVFLFVMYNDNSKIKILYWCYIQRAFCFIFIMATYIFQWEKITILFLKYKEILFFFGMVKSSETSSYQTFLDFLPLLSIWYLSIFLTRELKAVIQNNEEEDFNFSFLFEQNKVEPEKEGENLDKDMTKTVEEYYHLKSELQKNTFKMYLYLAGAYIFEFYWFGFFITFCLLFTSVYMSFSILIYIFIFFIIFISLFNNKLQKLNKSYFFILFRYKTAEPTASFLLKKRYYLKGILSIYIVSVVFFSLSYGYSIYDQFIREFGYFSNKNDYVEAFSYLLGIYVNISNGNLIGIFYLLPLGICWLGIFIQKIHSYFYTNSIIKKGLIKNLSKKMKVLSKYVGREAKTTNQERHSPFNLYEKIIYIRKGQEDISEEQSSSILKAAQNFLAHKKRTKVEKASFFKAIKMLIEEITLSLLIISAIYKINIYSFFYLVAAGLLYLSNQKVKRMFYLFIFLTITTLTQIIIFTLNISLETDPTPQKSPLYSLMKNLHFPLYRKLFKHSEYWAFFFGCGINRKQVRYIIFEFAEVFLIQIYFDLLAYGIPSRAEFSSRTTDTFLLDYGYLIKNPTIRASLTHLSEEKYRKIKECFRKICGVSLEDYKTFSRRYDYEIEQIVEKEKSEINKNKGKLKGLGGIFFLVSQNIILSTLLIFSILQRGFICLIYGIIAMVFLIKSDCLIKGEKSSFSKVTKFFLRPLVFIDISIHILFQTPLGLFMNISKGNLADKILESIGFSQIITYVVPLDSQTYKYDENVILFIIIKVIILFLLNLQNDIYSSPFFKRYYIGFLLTKDYNERLHSFLNAYLYNNKRIDTMKQSMKKRKKMNETVKFLEDWLEDKAMNEFENPKLSQSRQDSVALLYEGEVDDKIESRPSLVEEKKVKKAAEEERQKAIKDFFNKVFSTFLLRFLIFLGQFNFHFEKMKEEKNLVHLVRGRVYTQSKLQFEILKILEGVDTEKIKEFNQSNSPVNLKRIIDTLNIEEREDIMVFAKIFKKFNVFRQIIIEINNSLLNNFHYCCFIVMLLNNFFNSNCLSIFYPVIIFCYGLLEDPYPRKMFWNICLVYSVFVIVTKLIFDLQVFESFGIAETVNKIEILNYFGIKFLTRDNIKSLAFYCVFDCLVISFIMMEKSVLRSIGAWEHSSQEVETVEEGMERVFSSKYKSEKIIVEEFFQKKIRDVPEYHTEKGFFGRLFPLIRNEKPGGDFYIIYSITGLILVPYILFRYSRLIRQTQDESILQFSSFSYIMLAILFLHCLVCIFDRIFYLRQNRNDLTFEYIMYSKKTGKKLSKNETQKLINDYTEKISQGKEIKQEYKKVLPIQLIEEYENDYDISYIQKETKNLPLIFKYVVQIIFCIFSFILVFIFYPLKGNSYNFDSYLCIKSTKENEENLCNYFSYNNYIKILYIIYLIYFFFSALQISRGFYDIRKKSLLKEGSNAIASSINKIMRATPFLYEMKLTLDWACTPTSLNLFQAIKFHTAYDTFYTNMINSNNQRQKKVGEKIGIFGKIIWGWCFFILLMIVFLLPLLLYSDLNPAFDDNLVTGARIAFYVSFKPNTTFGKKGRPTTNYTLFDGKILESIEEMDKDTWELYQYDKNWKTQTFPRSQVQIVEMRKDSETSWNPSLPIFESLVSSLKDPEGAGIETIHLGFNYEFIRTYPTSTDSKTSPIKHMDINIYPGKDLESQKKKNDLYDAFNNCETKKILLFDTFYPSIRLNLKIRPKKIETSAENFEKIYVTYNCSSVNGTVVERHFSLSGTEKNSTDPKGVVFHLFNERVSRLYMFFSPTILYTTYILTLCNYLKNFLTNPPEKSIISETPEAQKLLNLCEGLLLSQNAFEFENEEKLYYILLEFLRSPDYMKKISKSSIEFFRERKALSEKKIDN